MEFSDLIIIDVREEFELLEKQIVTDDPSIFVLNIPARNIFANVGWINELSQSHTVYIVCKLGNRSGKVKNKYFKDNKNIISLDGGVTKLDINNVFGDKIKIVYGQGGMGMQQYIQLMFVMILSILALLVYFDIDKKYIIGLITLFVLFIVYQLLTKICYLFKMLPLPEFVPKK